MLSGRAVRMSGGAAARGRRFCATANPKSVGFLGLGTMGAPMALHCLRRFGQLLVFDTRPEAAEKLARAGATVAQSLSDFGTCDRLVLSLPDGAAVESVLLGDGGLTLSPDCLVIDCSTTTPETARRAAARLRFVDAPVTGERRRAEAATLTAMAGGEAEEVAAARPVLEAFSSSVLHMGGSGSGQLAKALNNALYNVSCAATAEVLTLATKAGLDTRELCRAVSSGSGQSFGFDKFAPLVGQRHFAAPEFGYPMGSAFKDMEVVARTQGGQELAVIGAARHVCEEALAMGLAGECKGAMAKVYEAKLGVTVKHEE